MHHADLYWSTDYYVTQDQVAMGTWLPLYQQLNSNISSVDNSGIAVSQHRTFKFLAHVIVES